MTQDEYQKKKARNEITLEAMGIEAAGDSPKHPASGFSFEDFLPVLVGLLAPKQHLTTPPTFTPQTLQEAIQLYDDGVNRRVYWFINKTWRYSTLT